MRTFTAFLLLLALPLLASAFTTTPCTRLPMSRILSMADNPEDTVETEMAIDSKMETETPVQKQNVPCPNCDLCDGSGRIEGGIGTVLTWWPIKAYRPCPNFIERGGQYARSGQGLDEIAFGRDSKYDGPAGSQ